MQTANEAEFLLKCLLRKETPARCVDSGVIVASYPRSGNTWARFVIANTLLLNAGIDEEVTFQNLNDIVPEFRHNRQGRRNYPIPGFYKTHLPYIKAYEPHRKIVIVRNPINAIVSCHKYVTENLGKFRGSVDEFARSWRFGAPAWLFFHRKWEGHVTKYIRFEELRENSVSGFEGFFDGMEVRTDVIAEAVKRSGKDRMRSLQRDKGDPFLANKDFRFVGDARVKSESISFSPETYAYVRNLLEPIARNFGYVL